MRRSWKIGLIALPWALLVLVVWNQVRSVDLFDIEKGTQANGRAHSAFLAKLAYAGCVKRKAAIAEAERRGWHWEDQAENYVCHQPTGLGSWLRVQVEPALPFSTADENDAVLGFDANGCMVDWQRSLGGPGTTCPDH